MSLGDKISEAEVEVMKILWREARPVPFRDILSELNEKMKWKKPTISTLLRRLQDKGVISVQEQSPRFYFYTPNITHAEYIQTVEKNLIGKLYGGSAKKFVAALCERGELSEADIDELKAHFQMGGGAK
ncbi:MAG: BlaI/MecI/CopY family transcriptional regulator [Clostridium sp.]|jgi:BlaI family penicillinase repressor|nr:BlaI/MecI/CopY family transcriptional regulator [Clostridium sp.]